MKGRVLASTVASHGYRIVALTTPGRREYYNVHALVALAFLGPPPTGQEVRHRNGVRPDCRLCNLHYGTRSQNALDRHEHGTMHQALGEKCGSAKLTEPDIRWIRRNTGGLSQRAMARVLGVAHRTVGAVQRGESWSHVNG